MSSAMALNVSGSSFLKNFFHLVTEKKNSVISWQADKKGSFRS